MSTKSNITLMAKYFYKVLFLSILLLGLKFKSVSQCNANFSYGSNGFNYTHDFKNLSTGSIYKTYKWDFGDGATSILTNPTHTYYNPNPAMVCLYLTDTSTKCKDTFCQIVYNCDSRFTFKVTGNSVDIPTGSSFLGGSDDWSWGDGFDHGGYPPPLYHQYSKRGAYTICHTKYCNSTDKTVTCNQVNLSCEAKFNYKTDPADSLKFIFTNQSNGYFTTYLWTFGEKLNYFKTDTNPTYKYNKAGYYNVELNLKENNSPTCRDSMVKTLILGKPPCDTNVYVNLLSNTEIACGSEYNHQDLKFDFGDGKFYFGQHTRYTYRNSGTYTVKISYVCYNKDTIRLIRRIIIPPYDSCLNLSLNVGVSQLNCADTMGSGFVLAKNGLAPYAYVWNTEPPTKGQLSKITKAGIYEVKVTDTNKCSKSKKIIFYGFKVNKVTDMRSNLSSSEIRPGRDGYFNIEAVNDGCVTANGKLFLVLDKLLIYRGASPLPTKIAGDTLFGTIVF